MRRLFIAIDFPDSVKTYLRGLTKGLSEISPDMPASFSKDFHLTLKFLGECTEERRQKIEKLLSQIPFGLHMITLSGLSTFGERAPRVLWVGVESLPSLVHTAALIEKNMNHLGFPPENRFVPHCTIARMKHIKNPSDFLEKLKSIPVRPLKFSVSQFHLFESHLSSRGAKYKILASFPWRRHASSGGRQKLEEY